jgi:hypothetical protein
MADLPQNVIARFSRFSFASSNWSHAVAFLIGEFRCRGIDFFDAFDLFDTSCGVRLRNSLDSRLVLAVSPLVCELLFEKQLRQSRD